ncbi:MAG: hypothetical protein JKY59_04530 [Emcibacter sp.]|nr:hypothetical protein [Emcibacter sp.]
MAKEFSLLMLPGDGIGPEIMAEARRVIDWMGDHRGLNFTVHEDLVGGAAYDVYGKPLSDDALELAKMLMRLCWGPLAVRNGMGSIMTNARKPDC